jgi:hypothetical protein
MIEDYMTRMDYVGLSDRMASGHSISKKTWKWMEKLFFLLLDLTILYRSCGGNVSHVKFKDQLVGDLVLSHKENAKILGVRRGQPSNSETQMSWLEVITFSALTGQRKLAAFVYQVKKQGKKLLLQEM